MSLNQHQNKEDADLISSEYDRYRSETIDKIDDLLLINQITEMDTRIHKNCLAILKIMKNVQNKLYNNYELKKEEIENFIYCLKFIDTLNIFMNNSMIDSMLKLTEEISNLIQSNNELKNKDDLLHKIKYAEKSIVYFKKKTFKNLYFSDSVYLSKEIEKSLNSINQSYEYSNNFDRKIFKQMQNIFWVLQKKLTEEQKKLIQGLVDDLKGTNVKSRSRRYTSYYDYNDPQTYYSSSNNYYNNNNYYGYSNYKHPSQNRRSDYYDPHYKKMDLIELPDVVQTVQTQGESYAQSNFDPIQENMNSENENFLYVNEGIERKIVNKENEILQYQNPKQEYNKESPSALNDKNDFHIERIKINKDYSRNNEKNNHQKSRRNRLDSKTDEGNYNSKDFKDSFDISSNNPINQEKNNKVIYKVVEVDINDSKLKINDLSEVKSPEYDKKLNLDQKEISKMIESPFNKTNIETVIISSTEQKDLINSNKHYNTHVNINNSKSNKKQKDNYSNNHQPSTKMEKSESKNTSKKSKKNKSHHLLVEIDYSKNEKAYLESNNNPQTLAEYSKLNLENEDKNANINEITNRDSNLTSEAEDLTKSSEKINKDNIEIIRHYQSDYEYNCDYETGKYGQYNSKYQKNYTNYYNKQISSSKTSTNAKEIESLDSITDSKKNYIQIEQKVNDDDLIVSNFTVKTEKDNIQTPNNKNVNSSNNKFRNKSYSTYNSYNYNGFNNYKNTSSTIQEKLYSDKESALTLENDKNSKFVIKEVEFLENKATQKESIEKETNEITDINKDKETLRTNNYGVFNVENQMAKSHSDLETNLNDLKLMDLKVNFQDYSENSNIDLVNNKCEKSNESMKDSADQINQPVVYETIKTYVNNHPRYNSGGSYKTSVKKKIGKYGKYHQSSSLGVYNADNINNEDGDEYYKNPYYNNKQMLNQIKDHTNNFLNKNYNNIPTDSNNHFQNSKNADNFYEKSNFNTAKKKNYSNNYKPEKTIDSNMNIYNEEESFNHRKITEYNQKDITNKDDVNIENQYHNQDRLKYEKEYQPQIENNDASDYKKENLNDELVNNNNFYSNKGHSNNFNSMNNNIDNRENVYNKNFQENSLNVYKDYNNQSNANNFHFVMNKNNSYLKNEKGNIMTGFQNQNEIYSNLYQDQNRNFEENKYRNNKNNTLEYDMYDPSKSLKNPKANQNNPSYIYNQSKETEDYVTNIRGREDYYDYANKLKNKKIKLNKSNNTNAKANSTIPQNDNNFNYYEHFNNPFMSNSNMNQNKFVNGNNMNSGKNTVIHNNFSNQNNIINMQNANTKKQVSNYKYNSTDIGLFSNLLGFNNKMNSNSNNNNSTMTPNNMVNSNMNMFNLGMLNYIHQMNMFNQISSINNFNNKMNGFQNGIINNNQANIEVSSTKSNYKKSEDSNNEKIDNKIEQPNEEFSEKMINEDTAVINIEEKSDPLTELSLNNKSILDSNGIINKNLTNNNDIVYTESNQVNLPKDVQPIGIFNMDIEKFFQSEAKDINLQNISQLEKKKDEIINLVTDPSHRKLDDVQPLFNQETITNAEIIENIPYKNNKEKYEFTSENETEKENLNENSSDQNDSDEEPSSDTSDTIPNEEIEAAFETFKNEIRQMHTLPIPVEADDDFYAVESYYNNENKEKVTKNNKAIFEEGDSNQGIEDKNKDKDLTMITQKQKTNIRNLTDIDINSNEEELEEDEQQPSDNDLYVNPNGLDTNPMFSVEKGNVDTNNKINENNNTKFLDQGNLVVNNKINENPKSVINNQIYNNFNFYNMQMIGNPNMIQYLNSLNNQKGKNNNNDNLNSIKMMENAKIIGMNYPVKNINNLINQNYTANIYNASQIDPKNLREQTKAYTDSVKTIDPDLLKIIKNKLTENTNTKSHKNSINLPENTSTFEEESKEFPTNDEAKDLIRSERKQDNIINENNNLAPYKDLIVNENKRTPKETNQTNYSDVALISNTNRDVENPLNSEINNFATVLNDGKTINFSMNKNMQLQNYLMSNWANFIFRGRDSNIHREYLTLKYLEQENPIIISKNIEGFEDRVLIPVYQKLIFNVNKRKGVYFFTFNRYRKIICKVLQNSKILRKVKPYGSLMNNFMIDSGDIDICIVPNCGILEFAIYLDKIKEELMSQKIAEHKLTHHTSRYMLLKVQDSQTKFVIDITVHNMLPILNTKLIRMYSIYDQRFHILGLYLKHWSKINKIHGAADNYLSSYALLVMLIHFLQNVVEPKVLPNLQKVEDKEMIYEYNQNGDTIKTNIYFEEDISKIKQNLLKLNQSRENIDSASSLLIKFFEYYSYNFDYYEQKISISKDKSECFKTKSDNIAFSIEDPFDNYHNPGKSMTINSNQFNKFITAMKKEINFILNGEYLKRLDKVTSMNNSNQSAINMQLQMHMKNLHILNNNQSSVNNTYKQNIH